MKGDAFMNSKKNNKISPVSDSVAPTPAPVPYTTPSSRIEAESGTNVNIKSNAKNTKDSDPTM